MLCQFDQIIALSLLQTTKTKYNIMRFYFVFISSFILLLPITSHVLASKPHNLTFNQLHWCFRTSRGLAGWTWWPRCPTSPSPSPLPSHSTSTSLSTAPSTRSLLLYYIIVFELFLNFIEFRLSAWII